MTEFCFTLRCQICKSHNHFPLLGRSKKIGTSTKHCVTFPKIQMLYGEVSVTSYNNRLEGFPATAVRDCLLPSIRTWKSSSPPEPEGIPCRCNRFQSSPVRVNALEHSVNYVCIICFTITISIYFLQV
jgi:hypothetical protein